MSKSDPAGWKTARNLVSSFSGKLLKIVVTKGHILRRKSTKFDFGWGSDPDSAGGAYSAPPDPQLEFREPTSKGTGGQENRGWEGREEERETERGGKGVDEGRVRPPNKNPAYAIVRNS